MATCQECGAPIAYEGAKCGACVARASMQRPPDGFEPEFGDEPDAGARCPRCGAALPGEGATCNACAVRDRFAEREQARTRAEEALAGEALREQAAHQQSEAAQQAPVPQATWVTWAVVGLLGGIVAVVGGVLWAIVKDDPQRKKLGWWTAAWGGTWIVLALVVWPAVSMNISGVRQAVTPSGQVGVTLAEYNSLRTGMTDQEVFAILGPGQEVSRSDLAGIVTVMYQWAGRGMVGANMNAMFQDGRLVQKAQFGLQ